MATAINNSVAALRPTSAAVAFVRSIGRDWHPPTPFDLIEEAFDQAGHTVEMRRCPKHARFRYWRRIAVSISFIWGWPNDQHDRPNSLRHRREQRFVGGLLCVNIASISGEFIPPGCTTPRRRRNGLLAAWVVSAFVGLVTSQNAGAACFVTSNGTVDCKADTITTNTTNLNGTKLRSSDRKQLFDFRSCDQRQRPLRRHCEGQRLGTEGGRNDPSSHRHGECRCGDCRSREGR